MAARRRPEYVRVCIDMSDEEYELLRFAVYIMPRFTPDPVSEVFTKVASYLIHFVNLEHTFRLMYVSPVEIAKKYLRKARLLNKYDPRKVSALLGELVTVIRHGLGEIPRGGRIQFDKVKDEEWEEMRKVIAYIEGKEYDPREYIIERLKRINDIAHVFGIRIIEEKGLIKGVEFKYPLFMYNWVGFIPRLLADC